MVARARSRLTLRASRRPRLPAPLPLLRARAWGGRGRRRRRRWRRALPAHRRQRREAAAALQAPKCSERRRAQRELGSRHCRRHRPSHSHRPAHSHSPSHFHGPDHRKCSHFHGPDHRKWAWCRRRPRLGLCLPGAWRHTRGIVSSGVPARRPIWTSSDERGNQRQSEVIRGHQSSSELIRGHQSSRTCEAPNLAIFLSAASAVATWPPARATHRM